MALTISNSSTTLYSAASASRTLISSRNPINFRNHHHNHNHIRQTKLYICGATSRDNNSSNYEAEEQRWLREEQRWIREEQRWLREEQRWNSERQSLLLQIQHLQAQLDRLRGDAGNSADFDVDFVLDSKSSDAKMVSKMAALLEGMVSESNKSRNQITDFSDKEVVSEVLKSAAVDDVVADASSPAASAPRVVPAAASGAGKEEVKEDNEKKKKTIVSSSLRMGAEGEEVLALQEALMNLGFYSGEEDMEFSSFSTGTDRAVKTWQASIGVREDGIMTVELLKRLFTSQQFEGSLLSVDAAVQKVDDTNGVVVELREVQQAVVKKGSTDVDFNKPRVFLLGENRWEEPSRLNKIIDKQAGGGNTQVSATKCLTCRGEGRLLCMECDGTGEPNVEEQFLEWVEGAPKCPYCDGLGYNVCDVCEGKTIL